ncbi:MAG: hypothetical protein J6386_01185 [Candidatus Synoicihabitans palmerolidicus]|nr:hypothetical protein [Candidatus Synoicihabitans palmerolidicus]
MAALAVIAYLMMFTTFMFYDDEGYVLISLRNFISGQSLYREVFSQYGPWPYVYHLGISQLLQSPITHTVGRIVTIIHWLICAGAAGVIAARLSRHSEAGASATLATLTAFVVLWRMVAEPSHPGSLVSGYPSDRRLGRLGLHPDVIPSWTRAGLRTHRCLDVADQN